MYKRILTAYDGYRKEILIVILLTFLMKGIELIGPLLFGKVIDSLTQKSGLWYTGIFAAIGLVLAVTSTYIDYFRHTLDMNKVWFPIQRDLRMKTIDRYFAFSIGQHKNIHSGLSQEIISAGQNSMQNLAKMIVQQYGPLAIQGLVSCIILTILSPLLGGITFFFMSVYGLLQWRMERIYNPMVKERRDLALASSKQRDELLRGVSLIKTFCQEERMRDRYRDQFMQPAAESTISINSYMSLWDRTLSLIIELNRASILIAGAYLIYNSNFSLGSLVTAMYWVNQIGSTMRTICSDYQNVLTEIASVEKFFNLIDKIPAIKEIENPKVLEDLHGYIRFENLHFSYPTHEDEEGRKSKSTGKPREILHNVNLRINAGQTVGIVGRTGSGKSTLMTLLLRGYDTTCGTITIDGYNLKDLSLREFYQQVAVVDQSTLMLDMSIRENLQMGSHKKLSDMDMLLLLKLVELDVSEFPEGLDRKVGQDGKNLSGGERQRLAIARALAVNPKILILDEATASLDGITEADVQKAISKASVGRTTIIIAHRLATIQNADQIFVLEKGSIISSGTHRELLKNSGLYMQFVEMQKILT
ncbi:MAG: ABC transporter ATP-binding protein [Minisyncoccota bacterium]